MKNNLFYNIDNFESFQIFLEKNCIQLNENKIER